MKRVLVVWSDGERKEYRCLDTSWSRDARNLTLVGVADDTRIGASPIGNIVIPLASVRWFKEDDRG